MPAQSIRLLSVLCVASLFLFSGCAKEPNVSPDNAIVTETKKFSSAVALKWQDLQLRILRQPAGMNPYGLNGVRNFAYCGVALYESVRPGMAGHRSLHGQLADMPAMPAGESGKEYHWAASANAALAYMNKQLFGTTSAANLAAVDSLESALNAEYRAQSSPEIIQRSIDFGKSVAEKIFEWSKTDGSLSVRPAFVPPTGVGIWSNTAPNPTGVLAPYWGSNRLFVTGSVVNTASPLPPPYSTDPASAYYAMVKEVYDVSQTLTPAQAATALYFRDSPGYPSGAHYVSIFYELMAEAKKGLDEYAVAHVKTGIPLNDALIGCWDIKYKVLVERPVRYIRNVMGHTAWSPLIGTPPHPDYPSGHSQAGGAFATAMTSLFGRSHQFTIRTYDYLGMAPRIYSSFDELADDIGRSRIYAGIHYTYSCVEGKKQGMKIATNVLSALKFEN